MFRGFPLLHTDGQKIAKRLYKGILKEANKLRRLLEEYNAVSSLIESSIIPTTLEEILSPACSIWRGPSYEQCGQVPYTVQRDNNYIEASLMKERSNEELLLLKTEMHNVIEYWDQRGASIRRLLLNLTQINLIKVVCVSCNNSCGKPNFIIYRQHLLFHQFQTYLYQRVGRLSM